MCVRACVCQVLASFTSFGQMLRCAHKHIVNIMKVYIEMNNMQVELIRFRKQYRLDSWLLLRDEVFSDRRDVYAIDGSV